MDAEGGAVKKLVTPAAHRAAASHLQRQFSVSDWHACRLIGSHRSTVRYQGTSRPNDTELRGWLRSMATERPRFGYRRLHALLQREGWQVNHKRVHRVYRGEGLMIKRRTRKRIAERRGPFPTITQMPDDCWSLDFMSDALATGRRFRTLGIIDTCTREALAIEVDTSLPGARVVRVLDQLITKRGRPMEFVLDNGPELISRVLDQWAAEQGIRLGFIEPGKPVQNAVMESFNGRFRVECLNSHWFTSLADARQIIEAWRQAYNQVRPHSSLNYATPQEVHGQLTGSFTAVDAAGLSE